MFQSFQNLLPWTKKSKKISTTDLNILMVYPKKTSLSDSDLKTLTFDYKCQDTCHF